MVAGDGRGTQPKAGALREEGVGEAVRYGRGRGSGGVRAHRPRVRGHVLAGLDRQGGARVETITRYHHVDSSRTLSQLVTGSSSRQHTKLMFETLSNPLVQLTKTVCWCVCYNLSQTGMSRQHTSSTNDKCTKKKFVKRTLKI